MTVPVPSNNERNINSQLDQERAHVALDDSTRHIRPGYLAYDAPHEDSWSLGSDNTTDFGPLPTENTTFKNSSSIIPHISTTINETTHLSPAQQHIEAQLAYWLLQAHVKSTAEITALYDEIPSTAGIRPLHNITSENTRKPRCHTYLTKHSAGSSVSSTDANHTWGDGPDADPIHRTDRLHTMIYGRICARRSQSVELFATAGCTAISRHSIDTDDANLTSVTSKWSRRRDTSASNMDTTPYLLARLSIERLTSPLNM